MGAEQPGEHGVWCDCPACLGPRVERRRRRLSDHMTFTGVYYALGGDPFDDPDVERRERLAERIVFSRWLGWLRTLAAIASPIKPSTPPAGRPDDEPAPVEPLDRLRTCWPNAPSAVVAREALAA